MTLQFGWWDHFEQRSDMPLWQQYDERIELIRHAEELGFYGYHIAEHHLTTLDMAPSPIVFLAAVARRTTKIRLGTMVLCLPLYHPTRLIQEFCMIDQLSHGRFMPGVGRGVRDAEHELFGSELATMRETYEEVLAILQQGLSTGRISHHGKRFDYDDDPVHFEMVQKPYPRFWYAGNLQRAAEQGMNGLGRATREMIEDYWRIWEAGRARNDPRFLGEDPLVGSTRHVVIAESDAEAVALARRAFVAYAEHFYCTDPRLGPHASPAALVMPGGTNFETMREAGQVLAGSPATVRDALRRYLAAVGTEAQLSVRRVPVGRSDHGRGAPFARSVCRGSKARIELKERAMANVAPAYQAAKGSPLDVDRAFYQRIADELGSRRLIEQLVVPIRSGRAWRVPAGHVFRIVTIDGPQVGDLNIWNAHNPRERMWASRSRQLQAAHVSTFDRLWSNLPYLRPLVTITADTLAGYGVDEVGGRVHDLLGTRCDPYVNRLLMGVDFDFHCHSNLVRAVAPHGLTEFDVHDVLNVFQVTGLNSDDQYFMRACPAKPGDYLEFFAEIDLLCAISACPGGDLSVPLWGPDARDPIDVCRPLGVEVYAVDSRLLDGWKPPEVAVYGGAHGMRVERPVWER